MTSSLDNLNVYYLFSLLSALFPPLGPRFVDSPSPPSLSQRHGTEKGSATKREDPFRCHPAILGSNHCVLRPCHLHRAGLSLLASLCALPSSLLGTDPLLSSLFSLCSSLCSLASSLLGAEPVPNLPAGPMAPRDLIWDLSRPHLGISGGLFLYLFSLLSSLFSLLSALFPLPS